jgi:hypothetical protein
MSITPKEKMNVLVMFIICSGCTLLLDSSLEGAQSFWIIDSGYMGQASVAESGRALPPAKEGCL